LEDHVFFGVTRTRALQETRILREAAPAAFSLLGDASEVHGDASLMQPDLDDVSFCVPAAAAPPRSLRVSSDAPVVERPFDGLVNLEHADGSWDLTNDFAKVLGQTLSELEAMLENATGDEDEVRRAWATALAVTWLEIEAGEWVDEWALLARKARKWLDRCPAKLARGESWLDAAANIVS
jgi:hypothetical protein